jgi:hypothetical protein
MPTLAELFDSLGCSASITLTASILLPIIGIIGLILCSLSAFVFFQHRFNIDPVFFYYRLLCLVYILHLLHNIPYGLLVVPRYFPSMNMFASTLYQIYYTWISFFLYHYEDVLQMAILLNRMKLFSPFIKKHFSLSPKRTSLVLFLVCLGIDLPFAFSFRTKTLDTYYDGTSGTTSTFYYITSSEFSATLFGKILLGFTNIFLSLILTLIVGVALNIISLVKYKMYARQRRAEIEQLEMSSIHNKPVTQREQDQLEERERTRRRIEKNLFYMALTQCSLSIMSRVLMFSSYVYFFSSYSFLNAALLSIILNGIYSIGPIAASLAFYSFNKMFRDVFKNIFQKWRVKPAASHNLA